jgi:hypothetical protein
MRNAECGMKEEKIDWTFWIEDWGLRKEKKDFSFRILNSELRIPKSEL